MVVFIILIISQTQKGFIVKKINLITLAIGAMILLSGCAPTVKVVSLSKNARDEMPWYKGSIPYYLPKPYLLIAKNFAGTKITKTKEKETKQDAVTEKETTTTEPSGGVTYSYNIIYLPDLNQKYGLKFTRGTGSFNTKITIEDGWKFVGINLDSDSKTAETISATGSAIKDIGTTLGSLMTARDFRIKEAEKYLHKIEEKDKKAEFYLYDFNNLNTPVLHWCSD